MPARVKERVNREMAKKNKPATRKRGEYNVYDVRRGMWLMVKGMSAHRAERDAGVPHQSLRHNFLKCLGFNHSKHIKICKLHWPAMEEKIAGYQLGQWGGHVDGRRLLPDEEELIVAACEFAAKLCFP